MNIEQAESGGALMTSLILGVLLSVIGGVAMNFAQTETEVTHRQRKETSARLLAESGVEQVIGWFNHGGLPDRELLAVPSGCHGTENAPDIVYDAGRADENRLLNDSQVGVFRILNGIGRVERIQLYGSSRPDGFCTVSVMAQTRDNVRRSVALELGAARVPPLRAAVQAGNRALLGNPPLTRIWAHWGSLQIAGDVHLGLTDGFPRRWATAAVTGVGYSDAGAVFEDRWTEAWVGGNVQSDDPEYSLPANVHAHQDPVPGLPADPWEYEKFKDLAKKFGRYYVPDRDGRLYRNGIVDEVQAQTLTQVIAENSMTKSVVFIDTLDQTPPRVDNLAALVLNTPSIEGVFFINAHVTFNPQVEGKTISAWSPPTEGQSLTSRVPVTLSNINVHGVLHTAGRLQVEGEARVFGAVVAGQGLSGAGLLEVWYDHDLSRGLVRGLPTVFPLSGTWREWGN